MNPFFIHHLRPARGGSWSLFASGLILGACIMTAAWLVIGFSLDRVHGEMIWVRQNEWDKLNKLQADYIRLQEYTQRLGQKAYQLAERLDATPLAATNYPRNRAQ